MNGAQSQAWERALVAARHPAEPAAWQQQLADALELAMRPDAVGVFLCSLGDLFDATGAAAPREHVNLSRRLEGNILRQMPRARMLAPTDLFDLGFEQAHPALSHRLRAELLAPAGFKGLTGRVLQTDDGMIAGWIAVFTQACVHERWPQIEIPFDEVCDAIERSLRNAIALATRMGASFPRRAPSVLSERERQVAHLAINACSDLNIAKRLRIGEGTVGRHLHNIFRKLGVSSRHELRLLLGTRCSVSVSPTAPQ